MILPAQAIRLIRPVEPFFERRTEHGMTYGLGPAGYDVRVAQTLSFTPEQHLMVLASTIEHFNMPNDVLGRVCDKSSWARRGLFVQNTVVEPGWRGYLTLELTYHGREIMTVLSGTPIAQIIFERLEQPTDLPYDGKYQDQKAGPQKAIYQSQRPEARS